MRDHIRRYVGRSIDGDCVRTLRAGRNFYVFGPPRTGKTHLLMRIADTLRASGLRVAEVDLNQAGQGAFTGDTLYFDLAAAIATPFGLPPPLGFWETYAHLPPEERWQRYLRSAPPGAPVILLIDGVEALVDGPYDREAFFAALGPTAEVGKTPVVVAMFGTTDHIAMGVDISTPGSDRSAVRAWFRTAVELRPGDFTSAEADALVDRLDASGGDARSLLDAVMAWTGGHPALTVSLVDAIGDGGPLMISGSEDDTVLATIDALFLEPPVSTIPTLAAAEAWVDCATPTAVARCWRTIVDGALPSWRPGNPVHRRLLMGGFVTVQGAVLHPRNRIFTTVFDADWCDARIIAEGLPARALAWLESARDPVHLLTGDLLRRASRWAEGRDVDGGIRELLLASWVHARHSERPAPVPPVAVESPSGARRAVAAAAVLAGQAHTPVEPAVAAAVGQHSIRAPEASSRQPIATPLKWLAVAVAVMTCVTAGLLIALWQTQGTLDATAAALLGRPAPVAVAPSVSPDRVEALETALARADARLKELETHGAAPAAEPTDELTFTMHEIEKAPLDTPHPMPAVAARAEVKRVARAARDEPRTKATPRSKVTRKTTRAKKTTRARKTKRVRSRTRRANTPTPIVARTKLDSATAAPGPIAPPSPQSSIARQAPTYRRSLVRCKLYDMPHRVRLSLTVKPDGRVSGVEMTGGSSGRVDVGCLHDSARRFRFAPFAGDTVTASVIYRL